MPQKGLPVELPLPPPALPVPVGVAGRLPLGEPLEVLQGLLLPVGAWAVGEAVPGTTVLDTVVDPVIPPLGVLPLPPDGVGKADWDSEREGVGVLEVEGLGEIKGVGVLEGVPMEDPLPPIAEVPVEDREVKAVTVPLTLPRLVKEGVEEGV